MLDKFVANLLTSYLGKYIANLDKQHVKVSIWSGYVVLHDLQLKPNALRYLDLPVSVKEGRIGELKVAIPWARLQSESVKVEISDVTLIVHPKKAATFNKEQEEQDEWERKEEELNVYESLRTTGVSSDDASRLQGNNAAPDVGDVSQDNSFAARLRATMLNNLQVQVTNIILQYEDIVTSPSTPIVLTSRIESFRVLSCDAEYRTASFSAAKAKFLFKLAELKGFTIVIETFTPTSGKSFCGRTCADISAIYQRTTANSADRQQDGISLSYVVEPVDFCLRLQHQPTPFQPQIPRWSGSVEIANTFVRINRSQWDAVWRSLKYVQNFEQYEMFRKFRPPGGVRPPQDPVAWWHFAISSVVAILRQKSKRVRFDWHRYVELKRLEREYMELHKRKQHGQPLGPASAKLTCDWLLPLTASELERHRQLEVLLPIESIKIARSLAYARLALEGEQHIARVEYLAKRGTSGQTAAAANPSGTAVNQKKGGGWWAWWKGTAASTEPVAESEEDAQQIEKLWCIIDSEKWSEEQRKVLAKELGIEDDDSSSSPTARPPPPTDSPLHQKTLHVFFRLNAVCVELLDYDNHPFGSFSMESLNVALRTNGNDTYEVQSYVINLLLLDRMQLAEKGSFRRPSKVVSLDDAKAIDADCSTRAVVRVARERQTRKSTASFSSTKSSGFGSAPSWLPFGKFMEWIPSNLRPDVLPAVSIRYAKLIPSLEAAAGASPNEGSPEFLLHVDVQPLDICASIPWFQKVVSFWGVDTKLIEHDGSLSQTKGGASKKGATDAVADRIAALLLVVERAPVTHSVFTLVDALIIIPEELEEEHECRIHFDRVAIENNAPKELLRKQRLTKANYHRGNVGYQKQRRRLKSLYLSTTVVQGMTDIEASEKVEQQQDQEDETTWRLVSAIDDGDWHNEWSVDLSKLSITCSWGNGFATTILPDLSSVIHLRRSIVPAYAKVPLLAVECNVLAALTFDAPMEGYYVFFSALTAVTDFLNNASGRGTAVASATTDGVKELFVCDAEGPSPHFMVADETMLTEQQRYYSPPAALRCRRLVEVSRGCVTLFHQTRPSMPFAKLELKPKMFHMLRVNATEPGAEGESSVLELYIQRGGRHHVSRENLDEARTLLCRHLDITLQELLLTPLAQLKALVGYVLHNRRPGHHAPLSNETIDDIASAFTIVEECAHMLPCQRVVFHCSSAKEADRLEKTISRSTAPEGIVSTTISPAAARDILAAVCPDGDEPQRVFDLMFTCSEELVLRIRPPRDDDNVLGLESLAQDRDLWETVHQTTTQGTIELQMDNVKANFFLTLFAKDLHLSAEQLILRGRCEKHLSAATQQPATTVLQLGPSLETQENPDDRDAPVFIMFSSSYLANVTPTFRVHCDGGMSASLNDDLAVAIELCWDFLSVATMKTLTYSIHRAIPWDTPLESVPEEDLLPKIVVDVDVDCEVRVDCFYETGGTEVLGHRLPLFPRGVVSRISGDGLSIRWKTNELLNESTVLLGNPTMETYFAEESAGGQKYCVFIAPHSPTASSELQVTSDTGGGFADAETASMDSDGLGAAASPYQMRKAPTVGKSCHSGSSLQFEYRILYPPQGVSETEWRESLECNSGYHFTNQMTLVCRSVVCRYWQPDLWGVIEYFTNGLMARFGAVAWRLPFRVRQRQHLWPPSASTPLPAYSASLVHKQIELIDVKLCLPHSAHEAPQLWGYLPYFTMNDSIEVDNRDISSLEQCASLLDGRPEYAQAALLQFNKKCESHNAFRINFTGLKLYAAKPLPGQHKVSTTVSFLEEDVLLRDPDFTDLVVEHLDLEYYMRFELASMLKESSAKTLGMKFGELHFHGSSEQLALLLDWTTGNFTFATWTPKYPPKYYPPPPFPNLSQRSSLITYDWDVDVERLVLHLRDPSIAYQATPDEFGPQSDRQAINVVVDIKTAKIILQWTSDQGFYSRYAVEAVDCWDFLRTSWKTSLGDMFAKTPREVVSANQNFLKLFPPSGSRSESLDVSPLASPVTSQEQSCVYGLDVIYGWRQELPQGVALSDDFVSDDGSCHLAEKVVYSETTIGGVELDVIPRFLFDLRDSLCSLRVRNAFAPLVKWPIVKPFQAPAPWDPKQQEWRTHHAIHVDSFTLVLFELKQRRPVPTFFATVEGVDIELASTKYSEVSETILTVAKIAQNGICDENLKGRPLLVPQSASSLANSGGARPASSNLLTLTKNSRSGLQGEFGCVWIFVPLKEQLRRLQRSLSDETIKELVHLGCWAEERISIRDNRYSPSSVAAAGVDTAASDIHFTIFNPCLVISEHESVLLESSKQRGVVINLGVIVLGTSYVASGDSPQKGSASHDGDVDAVSTRLYKLLLTGGHMRSLHRGAQHLIRPMNVTVQGRRTKLGVLEVTAKLDGLAIDVAQEYYEAVLRSSVRHFLLDEDDIVEQMQTAQSDSASVRSAGHSSATGFTTSKTSVRHRRSMSLYNEALTAARSSAAFGAEMSLVVAEEPTAAEASTGKDAQVSSGMKISLEWDFFQLRVHSDDVAVVLAVGKMTLKYDSLTEKRSCKPTTMTENGEDDDDLTSAMRLARRKGSVFGVSAIQESKKRSHRSSEAVQSKTDDDSTPELPPSQEPASDTPDEMSLPDSKRLGTEPTTSTRRGKHTKIFRRAAAPPTTTTVRLEATLHRFVVGVEGKENLVTLEAKDPTLPLVFEMSSVDQNTKTKADLGVARVFFEHDTLVSAISFLYEPYRRIVLPRYGAFEIKEVAEDWTLTQRLLLSSRTILRISSANYNHITINANGFPIHFLDAGKALIVLEAGVTLRIINATIYLYGKPLEHYVTAGNGSHVVLDNMLCTIEAGLAASASDEEEEDEDDLYPEMSDATLANFQKVQTISHMDYFQGADITWVPRDAHQTISASAAIYLLVPEHKSTTTALWSQGLKRALMLSSSLSFAWSKHLVSGDLNECGAFDVTELEAECQYMSDSGKSDFSSLISPWELKVHIEGERRYQDNHRRVITVSSPSGVDFRFRYGDVQLTLSAIHHAQAALGHIESNVLATAVTVVEPHEFAQLEEKQDEERQKLLKKHNRKGKRIGKLDAEGNVYYPAASVIYTNVVTSIPRVGVYVVDDSSSMDFPLFYVSLSNIATPVMETVGSSTKLHLSLEVRIEYYNFYASMWSRLLEPLATDIVLKDQANQSLQDVQARKGCRKAGVHLGSLRFHFTPMAADAVRRVVSLLTRLKDTTTGSSAQGASSSGPSSPSTLQQEFYAYEITQQLGPDLNIGFAHDDHNRFPKPRVLRMMEVFPFNFPRIDGRELPTSQHYITVSTQECCELLQISKIGLQVIKLQFGATVQEVVADIVVKDGKKRVTLRTNIAFQNNLPFPIVLMGVGSVFVNSLQTVPTESMRKRCVLVPQLPMRCHDIAMGVSYDGLPFHYGQTFLCTSHIDEVKRIQKAVYFILRFAPKLKISVESNLYDCRAIFEAPFSIVNNTGLPVSVTLLYKHVHQKTSRFLGFGDLSEKISFAPVDTIDIDAEASAPITCVDPFSEVFADVTIVQHNGAPLARTGATRQAHPALIRSQNKKQRDSSIILHDPNGETLIVNIDYNNREVVLWAPFWLVNQTQHYLQVTDSNPKRRGFTLAGMPSEGIGPASTPFIFGSEKMERLKDKAHIYIRVGRHTSNGSVMWSHWSESVLVNPIGEWSVFRCGDTDPISLAYSISFVGGAMKDTRVICITPRWIVSNRTPFSLNVLQEGVRVAANEDRVPFPSGTSKVLDSCTASQKHTNNNCIKIRLSTISGQIDKCAWSQLISVDTFGEQSLNVRYEQFHRNEDGQVVQNRRESIVIRVSTYRRGSILYVSIEKALQPPYIIENRSPFLVHVKQRDSPSKLIVYSNLTKGFVWDDNTLPPVLSLWASEGATAASKAITINFDPSAVIKRTKYQLQQELLLPGGVVLFVRVRALSSSFAISVSLDNQIDKMRMLPFFQFSYQFHVSSIFALVSSAYSDVMLLTIKPLAASVSQLAPQQSLAGDEDDMLLEFSVGILQIDDEREDAKQRVVMQLQEGKPSYMKLTRKMQRLTPIVHVTKLDLFLQPIEVHLEDSFLFELLKLVEAIQDSFGAHRTVTKQCVFEMTPWAAEIDDTTRQQTSEDSLQNKVAFIEHLLIEQIIVSLSLYRSHDAMTDPIRERLGFLSVLIRSVQDARVDWRRVEQSAVNDRIWLLATLYSNFYLYHLQQQMLNVLHVAGLDIMRGFVTDLLQGYFSSTVTTHIDRSRARRPRRQEANFIEDLEKEAQTKQEAETKSLTKYSSPKSSANRSVLFGKTEQPRSPKRGGATSSPFSDALSPEGSGDWDEISDAQALTETSRWLKFGTSAAKTLVSVEVLAYQVTFIEFLDQVTNTELKTFGHHAICHALRSRNFSSSPSPSLCTRCSEIEQIRSERFDSGSMSVLPHPDTKLLLWCEFAHHVSWDEFVAMCSPMEVRRYVHIVKDAIMGHPRNVIRIDDGLKWCLREE